MKVETESWLRSLVENAQHFILVVARDGTIRYINRVAAGFDRDAVTGSSCYDYIRPAHHDAFRRVTEQVFTTGEPRDLELEAAGAHGETRWYLTRISPMPGGDTVSMISTDITEHRIAREALVESERRFREMAETIQQVFWMTTPDKSKVLYVSPAYEKVWGHPAKELETNPRAFVDSIHPEDRARVVEAFPLQAQGKFDMEYRLVRPDGTLRWIRSRAFPIRDESGKVVRIAGVAEDVTARKQAEAQVEELARFPEENPSPVLRVDRSGAVIYANPPARRLLSSTDGIPAEWRRAVEQVFERGEPWMLESRLGGHAWQVSVAPVTASGYANLYVADITERERGEAALRFSETRLRAIVDHARDAIFIKDAQGGYLLMNPAAAAIFGLTPETAVGKTDGDLFSPDDVREIEAADRRVMETREAATYEREWGVRPGVRRAYMTTKVPYVAPDGTVVGVIGIAHDVTDRRRAERERQVALQRTVGQQDALTALTRAAAREGADLDANFRRLTEIDARTLGIERVSIWLFNASRTAIRCASLFELGPDRHSSGVELAAADYPAYFAAMAESDIVSADDAHADPRTAEFSAGYLTPLGITSMMDAPVWVHGELAGVVCHEHVGPKRTWTAAEKLFGTAVSNLAALQIAREEERKSQEHLADVAAKLSVITSDQRFLLSHTRDFLYRHDTRGVFTYLSPAVEAITGYTPEEWHTHYTTYLTENPINQKVIEYTENTLRTGQPSPPYLVEVRHKEGWHVMLEVNEQPYLEDDRVAGIIGIARDVTERIRAEEETRRLNTRLEAANRELHQFARVASHDLQEPLRKISGFAELLDRRYAPSLDAQAKEFLTFVRDGCVRMKGILDGLLELGRVSTRSEPFDTVDLHVVARDVVALYQAEAERDGGRIDLGPMPVVQGNEAQLWRLLSNLVGNAVRYRSKERPLVVRVGSGSATGGWEIWVEDNGPGIPADQHDRVFEPFRRAAGAEGKGSGLGLAICQSIVQRHGGTIRLRSRNGEGSRFIVTLPWRVEK